MGQSFLSSCLPPGLSRAAAESVAPIKHALRFACNVEERKIARFFGCKNQNAVEKTEKQGCFEDSMLKERPLNWYN